MKKLCTLFLAVAMMLSLVPSVYAATSEAVTAANALYEMGVFLGSGTDENGNPNFNLDSIPTRAEAVTMLVRLLGKESAAKNGVWETPFTDVADWAKPYVGFAYNNGLTAGTSATTFGSNENINATQYLTFVLRALGYSSGSDFQWDKAWELTDSLGITKGQYSAATTFTRGDMAIVSNAALPFQVKGSGQTLKESISASVSPKEEVSQQAPAPEPVVEEKLTRDEQLAIMELTDTALSHCLAAADNMKTALEAFAIASKTNVAKYAYYAQQDFAWAKEDLSEAIAICGNKVDAEEVKIVFSNWLAALNTIDTTASIGTSTVGYTNAMDLLLDGTDALEKALSEMEKTTEIFKKWGSK